MPASRRSLRPYVRLEAKGARYIRPVICCSAQVAKVDGSPTEPTIHFSNVEVVGAPVKKRLYGEEWQVQPESAANNFHSLAILDTAV